MSLVIVSCDKEETVAQTPAVPKKTKSEFHPVSTKSAAPKSERALDSDIAQVAVAAPVASPQPATIDPPPAIDPAPAAAKPDQSAIEQVTEQLRQERLARMAKAREERAVQMTAQMTERYKQQDANGDGLLSKDEVSERMQQRFAQYDKNGGGNIDASEQQALNQAAAQRMSEGGGGRRGGNNDGGGGFTRRGRGNP